MRRQVYVQRRKQIRSLLIFLTAVFLLFGLLIRTDRAIRPNLCAVCQSETQRYAARLMTDSIAQVLEETDCQDNDFIEIVYDDNGNVIAVETLSAQINQLQSTLLSAVQTKLDACRNTELEVSLGTTTGIWLFAGRGPHVSVRLMPIGNASITLVSELESAGINQTCHTIRAEVKAEVQAAALFSRTTAEVTFQYLIAETMIVGNVPETYLEFGS